MAFDNQDIMAYATTKKSRTILGFIAIQTQVIFNRYFEVINVNQTMLNRIDYYWYDDLYISPEHMYTKVNFDFYIQLSMGLYDHDGDSTDGLLGYAASGDLYPSNVSNLKYRPTEGFMFLVAPFYTSYPKDMDENAYMTQISTIAHEIMHAMGFTSYHWGLMIPSSQYLSSYTFANISGYGLIKTPTVLSVIREQTGCDTLEGALLENQGGGGTAGSHWDREMMGEEFMTGNDSSIPVLHKITMAMFQDMGVYNIKGQVDNKLVEPKSILMWNYKAGCAEVTNTCTGSGDLCLLNNSDRCHFTYKGGSVCTNNSTNNLQRCNRYVYMYSQKPSDIYGDTSWVCFNKTIQGNNSFTYFDTEVIDENSYNVKSSTGSQIAVCTEGGTFAYSGINYDCSPMYAVNTPAYSCPNWCLGRGTCDEVSQQCACDTGFSGVDCSQQAGSAQSGVTVLNYNDYVLLDSDFRMVYNNSDPTSSPSYNQQLIFDGLDLFKFSEWQLYSSTKYALIRETYPLNRDIFQLSTNSEQYTWTSYIDDKIQPELTIHTTTIEFNASTGLLSLKSDMAIESGNVLRVYLASSSAVVQTSSQVGGQTLYCNYGMAFTTSATLVLNSNISGFNTTYLHYAQFDYNASNSYQLDLTLVDYSNCSSTSVTKSTNSYPSNGLQCYKYVSDSITSNSVFNGLYIYKSGECVPANMTEYVDLNYIDDSYTIYSCKNYESRCLSMKYTGSTPFELLGCTSYNYPSTFYTNSSCSSALSDMTVSVNNSALSNSRTSLSCNKQFKSYGPLYELSNGSCTFITETASSVETCGAGENVCSFYNYGGRLIESYCENNFDTDKWTLYNYYKYYSDSSCANRLTQNVDWCNTDNCTPSTSGPLTCNEYFSRNTDESYETLYTKDYITGECKKIYAGQYDDTGSTVEKECIYQNESCLSLSTPSADMKLCSGLNLLYPFFYTNQSCRPEDLYYEASAVTCTDDNCNSDSADNISLCRQGPATSISHTQTTNIPKIYMKYENTCISVFEQTFNNSNKPIRVEYRCGDGPSTCMHVNARVDGSSTNLKRINLGCVSTTFENEYMANSNNIHLDLALYLDNNCITSASVIFEDFVKDNYDLSTGLLGVFLVLLMIT